MWTEFTENVALCYNTSLNIEVTYARAKRLILYKRVRD